MNKSKFSKSSLAAVVISVAIYGCGGGSSVQGAVSGVIFDVNGNPVRGATVYTGDKYQSQTVSNSNGTYVLRTVQGQFGTVKASLDVNGVQYYGQNLFQVFQGEQTKSVNITMVKNSDMGTISGTVYDRSGNTVAGAEVFAITANGYSSTNALTDNNGNYTLSYIEPGVTYTLSASARAFDQDGVTENLSPGENRTVNFSLNNPSGNQVAAPNNVLATAYTSPAEATRSLDQSKAIEWMKRLTNPAYAKAAAAGAQLMTKKGAISRLTPNGNLTEVDLTWTAITDPALYGYGIYGTSGTGNPNQLIDFLQDPLASLYADLDDSLQVGQTYTFGITAINSLYGQSNNAESALSAPSSCTVLGDLTLGSVDPASVTFNWQAASGATQYTVYLFDQYPDIGVTSIWNTESAPTSNNSQAYNGAGALVSGSTYYYIVVGKDAAGDGETFSPVGSFVKS